MLALVLFATASSARASDGAQVLAEVDKAMTTARDQILEVDMTTKEAGQAERVMTFKVNIKGTEWRRIDFMAPGDVKGMRILIRSVGNMYVYLPAFKKVRRVASHVKEQGFMGTAFGQDEMSLATFGAVYTAKLVEEGAPFWKLEATRKPDIDFPFSKLLIEVRKDLKQPVEIQYFNDAGVKQKTETRLDFRCSGAVCTPGRVEMVDHTRGDLKSVLTLRSWQANPGLDDDFFSVRALQRSE